MACLGIRIITGHANRVAMDDGGELEKTDMSYRASEHEITNSSDTVYTAVLNRMLFRSLAESACLSLSLSASLSL